MTSRLHRAAARHGFGRRRLVLVVGVMRSGSTLLTNVLISNPEISGFGESHLDYRNRDTVLDLAYWVFRFTGHYPRRSQHLLDKVLHARHTPQVPILAEIADLKVIFLLRQPDDNATSLQSLFDKNPRSTGSVGEYLLRRYDELGAFAAALPPQVPVHVLTYDQLISDPQPTLDGVSRFLGLAEPLTAEHDVPAWAGRWGIGDGSDHIRSGRIRNDIVRPSHARAVPSRAVSTRYAELLDQLTSRTSAPD